MKIKILRKRGDVMQFVVDGITPAFANTLRRITISEVPTLAVEWIDVRKNSSVLFDEVIAHRMGMIPVKLDPKRLNFTENCKCEDKGCPLCQVIFTLNATGPRTVYSGDLKSSNKDIKPIDPRFPIVELLKDQNIEFEAVARLGLGKDHAKWQASNTSYTHYPELTMADNKNKHKLADHKKCVKSCPKGLLKLKGKKIVLTDPLRCDLCKVCEETCKGLIKIKTNENKLIFRIETVSGLTPEQIVTKAVEILGNKAEEFKRELKKI